MTDPGSSEPHDAAGIPGGSMREIFAWMIGFNLDQVIRFHNAIQRLLRDQLIAPSTVEDRVVNDAIELYDKMNSGNTLLMALSFLEEMLIIFWRRRLGEKPILERRFNERYRPLFRELKIEVGELPCWSRLVDAMEIRHCLLHANGRVSYMKRPEDIHRRIERYPGLDVRNGRLRVTVDFLKQCVGDIRELRDELVSKDETLRIAG